jgi:hypothetical protein
MGVSMATMASREMDRMGQSLVFPATAQKGQLTTALVAGFVATHIATVSGYWFHGVNLPDLGWPNFNGILLLGTKASALSQFWAGAVFHFLTGICFALFYAFIVHPRLRRWTNTLSGNLIKALLFSLVLATISAIWWVPQLFNSEFNTNLGWFSQNVGKLLGVSAWKAVFGIYVWHIIYGVNLGLIYSPRPAEG